MGSPGPATGKRRRGETGKKPSPLQLPNPNTIARPYVTIAQVASGQPVAGVRNTRNGGLLPPRISPVGQLALGPPVGCTLLIIRRDARPTPAFERVDPLDRVEELARKRKARPPGGEFRRRPVEAVLSRVRERPHRGSDGPRFSEALAARRSHIERRALGAGTGGRNLSAAFADERSFDLAHEKS